jgi:hypothetical protein
VLRCAGNLHRHDALYAGADFEQRSLESPFPLGLTIVLHLIGTDRVPGAAAAIVACALARGTTMLIFACVCTPAFVAK